MTFLMIRESVWNALSDDEQEQIRAAEHVRLGGMPLWIDTRDHSRWRVAHDGRSDFARNVELVHKLAPATGKLTNALALPNRPDWARAATEEDLQEPAGLDVGVHLLQAVTARERNHVERILDELWRAIEADDLSPGQAEQVRAMAMTLHEAHRETRPGTTERWKLVGPARTTLTSALTVMNQTAAAITIAGFVSEAGWTELAAELSKIIS